MILAQDRFGNSWMGLQNIPDPAPPGERLPARSAASVAWNGCNPGRPSARTMALMAVPPTEFRLAMGEALQRFDTGDRLALTARGWKIAQPLISPDDSG